MRSALFESGVTTGSENPRNTADTRVLGGHSGAGSSIPCGIPWHAARRHRSLVGGLLTARFTVGAVRPRVQIPNRIQNRGFASLSQPDRGRVADFPSLPTSRDHGQVVLRDRLDEMTQAIGAAAHPGDGQPQLAG